MDTLCIPFDDEYAELWSEAINKIAACYAQPTGTLILDSELQRLRIAVLEAEEALARIAHSAWAALAKALPCPLYALSPPRPAFALPPFFIG